MATLINGNGNPAIYAGQDADLIAALAGDVTGIAQIGNKFAATAVDANTISVADGVIVTKEGRRIQLDAGSTDAFTIPTGTAGTTNYYIIGYLLTTEADSSQVAETFVQLMDSSTATIEEDTFRSGATDVYVSLYRIEQDGVNLGTITALLPELTSISQLNTNLSNKGEVSVTGDGTKTYTQLLNELYALVDRTKLDGKSYFIGAYGLVAKINGIQTSYIGFNSTDVELNALKSTSIGLKPSASFAYSFNRTTVTDNSSNVVTSGTVLKVVY